MAACFLRTREFGDCGEFRGITEFVSLDQCNNDLSQHLSRCHLSQERITEGGLILARSGLFCTTEAQRGEMFVCPKHRAYLGQYWGNQTKSRSCKYPEHKGERKAARTNRAFTLRVSREVMEMFGFLVPVGAREYLPLNSSVNFYLKELRLMNNLFNERVFSSLGMIFFQRCVIAVERHTIRGPSVRSRSVNLMQYYRLGIFINLFVLSNTMCS